MYPLCFQMKLQDVTVVLENGRRMVVAVTKETTCRDLVKMVADPGQPSVQLAVYESSCGVERQLSPTARVAKVARSAAACDGDLAFVVRPTDRLTMKKASISHARRKLQKLRSKLLGYDSDVKQKAQTTMEANLNHDISKTLTKALPVDYLRSMDNMNAFITLPPRTRGDGIEENLPVRLEGDGCDGDDCTWFSDSFGSGDVAFLSDECDVDVPGAENDELNECVLYDTDCEDVSDVDMDTCCISELERNIYDGGDLTRDALSSLQDVFRRVGDNRRSDDSDMESFMCSFVVGRH